MAGTGYTDPKTGPGVRRALGEFAREHNLPLYLTQPGLPLGGAQPFGGWETPYPSTEGDDRGHFTGHYLSATSMAYASASLTHVCDRMCWPPDQARLLRALPPMTVGPSIRARRYGQRDAAGEERGYSGGACEVPGVVAAEGDRVGH